jgi:hypothetical protein
VYVEQCKTALCWVVLCVLGGCLGVEWLSGWWVLVCVLGGCLGVGWFSLYWLIVWVLGGCLDVGWLSGWWVLVCVLGGGLGVGWFSLCWVVIWVLHDARALILRGALHYGFTLSFEETPLLVVDQNRNGLTPL